MKSFISVQLALVHGRDTIFHLHRYHAILSSQLKWLNFLLPFVLKIYCICHIFHLGNSEFHESWMKWITKLLGNKFFTCFFSCLFIVPCCVSIFAPSQQFCIHTEHAIDNNGNYTKICDKLWDTRQWCLWAILSIIFRRKAFFGAFHISYPSPDRKSTLNSYMLAFV